MAAFTSAPCTEAPRPGTSATIYFPARFGTPESTDGQPLSDIAGIHEVKTTGTATLIEIGFGTYTFTSAAS